MAAEVDKIGGLQGSFYRENFRRLMFVFFVMLLTNFALLGTFFYQISQKHEPKYYAVSPNGQAQVLVPFSAPILSSSELLQWAERVAVLAYNYNFNNYPEIMSQLQNYFTSNGWKYYQDALTTSGLLDAIISKKLLVTAVTTADPVINDRSYVGGLFSWMVQVPMLVTYESQTEKKSGNLIMNMVISRVPVTLDIPKGIAIQSLIAAPSGEGG